MRFAALAPLLAALAFPSHAATVVVTVQGTTGAGAVRVAVCAKGEFLGATCGKVGQAPPVAGGTRVIVADVPAGRYAVQAFQDNDGTGKLKRDLFGRPTEPFGFSRLSAIAGRPAFDDAAIDVAEPSTDVAVTLFTY